ncbi:MAG: hypothetical protein E7172_06350 [Firmicutes bacterium]|nr:hypothetical protein [Bacillota bacterium]
MNDITIELLKKINQTIDPKAKPHLEKFIVSLSLAYPENLKTLKNYDINITRGSQLKLLTIDPRTLLQALELSDKMGFIDAYKENPVRLCQAVSRVINRMAKCDANGVVYKDAESGKFGKFIFSERLFNDKLNQLNVKVNNSNEVIEETTIDIDKAKELALRVIEEFGLKSDQEEIFNRLEKVVSKGFSYKESLLEVFKVYGGDLAFLSSKIDEILSFNEEMGRVA